eukprot:scaffold110472_cov45-Phaeocystis_antarctica.AAC.1
MYGMFWVRASPCPAPSLQSSPPLQGTPLAPRSFATSRLPARTSPRIVCPPFDSRQQASAFNQPLSFDTSIVTNMYGMFYVRLSSYPAPNLQSSPPLHAACTAVARRLPPPGLCTSLRTECPPFDSRQIAQKFNQPLSFDTSSVTTMNYMFSVRSFPCPAPNLRPSPPLRAACAAVARRLRGLPVLCTSPCTVCPPFDSRQGASAFNQPLSFDTSNVTTMQQTFWVRSSPCPASNLQSTPPLRAACTAVARRLLPPGTLHLAPHRMPSADSRQVASAFNQPLSFDTSSVTNMWGMFSVRSSPCPAPNLQPSPPHARCVRRGRPPPPRPPGLHLTPHRMPPAVRKLLVQRQQAAHPLRMGGHLGLCLCWLWLELGSGKLSVAAALAAASVASSGVAAASVASS